MILGSLSVMSSIYTLAKVGQAVFPRSSFFRRPAAIVPLMQQDVTDDVIKFQVSDP